MEGISQSLLKKLWTNPKQYENPIDEDTSYFKYGTLVDFLLTEPESEFNNKYIVCSVIPGDKLKDVIDGYTASTEDYELSNTDELVSYARKLDYYSSIKKPDVYINKLINDTTLMYAAFLANSKDKIILTQDEYQQAKMLVGEFKSNPYTSWLFDSDRYKIYNKVVVSFELFGRECKAEIDRVLVARDTFEVIPIDFKTTSKPLSGFTYSFWNYRYDVQAVWYRKALETWIASEKSSGNKDVDKLHLSEDFFFCVGESTPYGKVMLYNFSSDNDKKIIDGFTSKSGREYKGIYDLFERLDFHEAYGFDYPMEYMQQAKLNIQLP